MNEILAFEISQQDLLACTYSIICGLLVGLEREIKGRPSGLRTQTLISLGCCAFVIISNKLESAAMDPTRVLGQIVTGIGFLGAGVIMNRDQNVFGLTSAATIWVTAAIGCTMGLYLFNFGFVLTALALFVLVVVEKLHSFINKKIQKIHTKPG
jgi:putative Mg2+ transporter-C (MgtC) family protein